MKREWCLIQSGREVHVKFIDPEKEGALSVLLPEGTGYEIDGVKAFEGATQVVFHKPYGSRLPKLSRYLREFSQSRSMQLYTVVA